MIDPETGKKELKYQWEALNNKDCGEIITAALDQFCNHDDTSKAQAAFDAELKKLKKGIKYLFDEMENENG